MSELYLELANIRIRVSADAGAFGPISILQNYIAAPGCVEHNFHAKLVEQLEPPVGQPVYAQNTFQIYRDNNRILHYTGEVADDPCRAYMRTIRQDSDTLMEFRRDQLPQNITGKVLLTGLDLPHLLAIHHGFLLHASYITYKGRAILFTAPSETGKSTQAQLWCDHMGAELINGDRAAVRVFDDGIKACGIPFAGSSQVRKNVTAPLAAIVYLSQAPDNTITRLRGIQAFRRIWEGCTVNAWNREDMELSTNTVSQVISQIPVYHLACTPDVRAVELLKNAMEVNE